MKMRTKAELFAQGLPKWPQLIITGEPVSEEQALEIIRRTDYFFKNGFGGNNHKFNDKVIKTVKLPQFDGSKVGDEFFDNYALYAQAEKEWKKNWQYLTTAYVCNDWISCAYIGGPNGWMHPDGIIGFSENIGKWPEIKEVYDDFCRIAKAFPFLNMEATLMNGEQCEDDTKPVVSFKIKEGKVRVIDPNYKDVHDGKYPTKYKGGVSIMRQLTDVTSENAIPLKIIESWASR